MNTTSISTGGTSQAIAVGAVSAQSAVIQAASVIVTPMVDVFCRRGVNPVALADGSDQILLAGFSYRVAGLVAGDRIAFIAAAAGTVYLTPGV